MEHIKKFKFWSNVFHLFPLFLAAMNYLWFYALVYLGVVITSFTYHYKEEKDFVRTDVFLSFVLFFLNIYLVIRGHFWEPYFVIGLGSGVFSLYFYLRQFKNDYNLNHGLWHLFSAGCCYFCILTFLYYIKAF
jgi:hypothetical protein